MTLAKQPNHTNNPIKPNKGSSKPVSAITGLRVVRAGLGLLREGGGLESALPPSKGQDGRYIRSQ